ncbi:MAG TPA: glycoside hydrolase family 88 protein [Polyangia bacterium]|jgi:rhamnogalacturonyl hydrolase YesR|nr:glycoside hydrolase family 88 protein [Polyangia bacterium]
MSLARRILSLAVVLSPLGCGGGSTPGGVAGAAGTTGAAGASGAAGVIGAAGATGTVGGTGLAGEGGAGMSGGAGDTGIAGSTGNDASTTDATNDGPATTTEGGTDGAAPTLDANIVALMRRVADNFLRNPDMAKDWISGSGWTGIMATYQLTHDPKYLNAIKTWAGPGWTLANGAASRGDNQCAAQTYFDAYLSDPTPANMVMLNGAKPSYDQLVANPPKGRVEWWWEDALFMVPAGFARLGKATGDNRYFTVLDGMWWDTYAFLFNVNAGLMYRDDQHRNEFWARGNGWVIAGTARVLQYLPADDPKRADYVKMLDAMAAALTKAQGTDGMWRSNLLNPNQFPNKETSGSGFNTFGIAWGINNGVLDRATYLPVVKKAWTGLLTVVDANGMVGWVQGVGAGPGGATAGSTAPFGVGAWLLAASEMAKLAP